ncbi:MAG: hypothetical protein RR571_08065 [Anaerorhabdus sp.]
MVKKLSNLQIAQQRADEASKKTNEKIEVLGQHTRVLYTSLTMVQSLFDRIRNVPEEDKRKYEELKAIRVHWKQQAENIEIEYKKSEVKVASQGAAGIGAGVAVAALGPTAAMGIATTFGVASTGTAISTLSGAAATNAALAWLGGGALIAGGGGMAAGSMFLTLAGPVGWAIAGISIVSSGLMFFKTKSDKKRLENIFTLISNRDIKSYELATVELGERIKRIVSEAGKLAEIITKIKTFGTDYTKMTEAQQYELGAYVNLMEASTMLLVNPIIGLQPKYTELDFEKLCSSESDIIKCYLISHKNIVILMANLLYKIKLDDKDRKLLTKALKKDKEFLSSVEMTKNEFDAYDIAMIERALNHKYKFSKF